MAQFIIAALDNMNFLWSIAVSRNKKGFHSFPYNNTNYFTGEGNNISFINNFTRIMINSWNCTEFELSFQTVNFKQFHASIEHSLFVAIVVSPEYFSGNMENGKLFAVSTGYSWMCRHNLKLEQLIWKVNQVLSCESTTNYLLTTTFWIWEPFWPLNRESIFHLTTQNT